MEKAGRNLIIVPQYPTPLRYQEWWFNALPKGYESYFDKVIRLSPSTLPMDTSSDFLSSKAALRFEAQQIDAYLDLELTEDDILLVCDLSFPGLFPHVLLHKRPRRAFAICHATSINYLDIFQSMWWIKYPIEHAVSMLFDKVFIASKYHQNKLSEWRNTKVVRFPHPPIYSLAPSLGVHSKKTIWVASVARDDPQKVDYKLESTFEDMVGVSIQRFREMGSRNWSDYYQFLSRSKYLLITSREETYGYQVVDALSVGCIPIAPRAFSYLELLPKECLYEPGSKFDLYEVVANLNRTEIQPGLWSDTFFEDTARIMLSE